MRTTPDYTRMMTEFQSEWDGNKLDLMQIAMTLDAANKVLKHMLKKKPTPNQVIAFSKVVALQLVHGVPAKCLLAVWLLM